MRSNALLLLLAVLASCSPVKTSDREGEDRIGTPIRFSGEIPESGSPGYAVRSEPPMPYLDYLESFDSWSSEAFPDVAFGRIFFEDLEALSRWHASTGGEDWSELAVLGGRTKVSLHDPEGDRVEIGDGQTPGAERFSDYWIYVIWKGTRGVADGAIDLGIFWEDSTPVAYALVRRQPDPELHRKAMEYHQSSRRAGQEN